MLSKLFTLMTLTAVGGYALSAAADKGYPNAIVLRSQIKNATGFDLAALTADQGGDSHLDLRQRFRDKLKEWKAEAEETARKSADGSAASPLLHKTAAYSSQAVSASNFLERNLTTEGFMFSGRFTHIGDDICHIRTEENVMLARLSFDFFMSDIDVNSLTMKSTDSTDWLNVESVKEKHFSVSRYDGDSERWGSWEKVTAAVFVATPSNQQNIMKAMDVLAVECGAPEGF